MGIYRNSRYTNTNLYYRDNGTLTFINRRRSVFNTTNSSVHIFKEGETLYNLAYEYYGDTQLWWVILDANPKFRWEGDIPYGTALTIPDFTEVIKCLQP